MLRSEIDSKLSKRLAKVQLTCVNNCFCFVVVFRFLCIERRTHFMWEHMILLLQFDLVWNPIFVYSFKHFIQNTPLPPSAFEFSIFFSHSANRSRKITNFENEMRTQKRLEDFIEFEAVLLKAIVDYMRGLKVTFPHTSFRFEQ